MSNDQTVESQPSTPSTQRKIASTVAQVAIGLAVTVVASAVTDKLNKKVSNLIIPDNSDN